MNLIYFIQYLSLLGCLLWSQNTQEPKPSEELPNIVWITSEDNSKHYMKLFDYQGVEAPFIESLAIEGLSFAGAFSNAPVCSAARSTIISGCYGPRLASHYHRNLQKTNLPDSLEMFPAYLRKAGYYTTNNSKEDYNFYRPDNVWNESSKNATWRNRSANQPFFHVQNIGTTHEGKLHFSAESMKNHSPRTKETDFYVQPNHPQTDLFKYTNAYYRDLIQKMDQEVGAIIQKLKEDKLLENTFIFYFGDHGGVLPGSKGYLYETGLHVPMVVYIPPKFKHWIDVPLGSQISGFVSFVDLAATVLNLAGIQRPSQMDGQAFLGENISLKQVNQRDETFAYADRFDEKYDMVRSIRKGQYKYIWNLQPYHVDGLMNNYRYKQLAYQEWYNLFKTNQLDSTQTTFFKPRPSEMLFDIGSDPYETKNLAQDPAYQKVLMDLRKRLQNWMKSMPDLSLFPEYYLIENALENPALFGKQEQARIQKLIEVAALNTQGFAKIKKKLKANLQASDPWQRFWALNVCMYWGQKAKSFVPIIQKMMDQDSELINQISAAQFLGMIKKINAAPKMTQILYKSQNGAEALWMLNCITLMQDYYNHSFEIAIEKLHPQVQDNPQVKRRLTYLNAL